MIFVFSVADNRLGPEGAKILADMLSVSTSMTSLNLASTELTKGNLKKGATEKYGSYGGYEASAYETSMTGVKAIADALSVSSSMKKLIIFKNRLGDEGIRIITSAVEGKEISLCGAEPEQTDLDLSGQHLGPEDAKIIAWELTTGFVSSSMTFLDLSSNALTKGKKKEEREKDDRYGPDEFHTDMTGIKAIADALSVSSSLTSLK